MSVILLPVRFARLLSQSIVLALVQIWSYKMRAVLTTVGIVIGVASVTAVIAGLTGLKTKVEKEFAAVGIKRIGIYWIWPEGGVRNGVTYRKLQFRPEHVEGLVENCPSVDALVRKAWEGSNARSGSESVETVDTFGVDPRWEEIENTTLTLGRPVAETDERTGAPVCVIPEVLRDKLRLDKDCVGQVLLLGGRLFRIIGVFTEDTERLFAGGDNTPKIYMPFGNVYRRNDEGIYLDALAKSADTAEEAKAEITFFLRKTRQIKPGEPDNFAVRTVQEGLDSFNAFAAAMTAVAAGIVAISLVVGGIGIMNIMLVSVSERTREIGLRKAVGAKSGAIMLQFLVEAVMLCLAGGLIGLGVGQLMTYGMTKIPNFPLDDAYIPLWAVALALAFSSAVGLVFGMLPAVKAARLDPIEALRHE